MRLAASGAAPVETDIDDYGLIGGIGLQRRANYNEMPISAPIALRDINQKRNIPPARRWTIVHETENPNEDAKVYGGKPLTEQDWDLGPFIWRCDLCQYQWYNVSSLDRRYEGVICLHCNYHMIRFDRPSHYPLNTTPSSC